MGPAKLSTWLNSLIILITYVSASLLNFDSTGNLHQAVGSSNFDNIMATTLSVDTLIAKTVTSSDAISMTVGPGLTLIDCIEKHSAAIHPPNAARECVLPLGETTMVLPYIYPAGMPYHLTVRGQSMGTSTLKFEEGSGVTMISNNNIYISHSSVRFEEMTMDTSALVVAANLIGGGDGARIDLTNVDIQATSAVRRSYTLSDASIGRILGSKISGGQYAIQCVRSSHLMVLESDISGGSYLISLSGGAFAYFEESVISCLAARVSYFEHNSVLHFYKCDIYGQNKAIYGYLGSSVLIRTSNLYNLLVHCHANSNIFVHSSNFYNDASVVNLKAELGSSIYSHSNFYNTVDYRNIYCALGCVLNADFDTYNSTNSGAQVLKNSVATVSDCTIVSGVVYSNDASSYVE